MSERAHEPDQPPRDAGSAAETDGRVLRARAQRAQTHAQILAAAQRVFGERGYHRAGIQELLEAADVARATFYAHFSSKGALFAATLDAFLARLAEAIRPVIVAPDAPPVREQLVANFQRVLRILEGDPGLTRQLLQYVPGAAPTADVSVASFYRGARSMIMRSIQSGVALGLVVDGHVELRATFVLGAVKEAVSHTIVGEGAELPRDLLADQLLAFALRGLLR